MAKYSLRDIKNAYNQKKDWEKQFPVSYYMFRPLSFYIAYIVLRLTTLPSSVAWVGFSLGLVGCGALLFLKELSIFPGIVLLILCALSDAVDGNVARTTHSVTYYGKLLDGLLGAVVEGSYGLFLGLGLYRAEVEFPFMGALFPGINNRILFILTGALFTISWFFANLVSESYTNLLRAKENGTSIENLTAPIQSSTFRNYGWYKLFINLHAFNLQLLALIILESIGNTPLFLILWTTYYLVRAFVHFIFYLKRAQVILS